MGDARDIGGNGDVLKIEGNGVALDIEGNGGCLRNRGQSAMRSKSRDIRDARETGPQLH